MSNQQRGVPNLADKTVEKLAAHPREVGWGLFGLALLLAAIPITAVTLYGSQSLWLLIWGIKVTIFVLLVASWVYWRNQGDPGALNTTDRMRVVFLLVLGGLGFFLALYGLVLPFTKPPYAAIDYPAIFTGGIKSWRDNRGAVVRCLAPVLGGLVLMFVGVQSARAFERTNTALRRVVYGYNAILTSLLVILILAFVNILPYSGVWPFSYANESIDWTRTGLHSLHDATRNLVADLKQPVKVYVLGSSNDQIMKDMVDLLDRCRSVNPQQFSWEQLSRDRNSGDLRDLIAKYSVPDSQGVLVVYGSEKKALTEFIRRNDLYKTSPNPREARYDFKGENALLNAMIYLSSSKSRAVVYFTQGNGELDFKDRMGGEGGDAPGMGQLVEELGRINYETRELTVTAKTEKVPEDADIVVVARPAQPLSEKFLKALRDYLHGVGRKESKKGKLVVLFDVVTERGKDTMVHTGLENLVAEYGIRVNDNQLVDLEAQRDYLSLQGAPFPAGSNPITKAFFNAQSRTLSVFRFYQARSLEAARTNPPGAPAGNVPDILVVTFPQKPILPQTDLSIKGAALIREIEKNPAKFEIPAFLPLAMAVSEGASAAPPIPGHEHLAKEGQPRLVVFGDASWISNGLLLKRSPNNFNLFASCLGWLVERPDLGMRVPNTEHDIYVLKAAPGSENRLLFLPGVLMVMGVMALGIGVWVVRRR